MMIIISRKGRNDRLWIILLVVNSRKAIVFHLMWSLISKNRWSICKQTNSLQHISLNWSSSLSHNRILNLIFSLRRHIKRFMHYWWARWEALSLRSLDRLEMLLLSSFIIVFESCCFFFWNVVIVPYFMVVTGLTQSAVLEYQASRTRAHHLLLSILIRLLIGRD